MGSSSYRFNGLLALFLLGSNALCREAAAQSPHVKHIQLYAQRLSAFIRFPIDSLNIIAYNRVEATVRHPHVFLLELERVLALRPAPASREFGHDFVRLLYLVTYADGRTARLQVDRGRAVLWHQKLFLADSATVALLLSPLTRKQRAAILPQRPKRPLRSPRTEPPKE